MRCNIAPTQYPAHSAAQAVADMLIGPAMCRISSAEKGRPVRSFEGIGKEKRSIRV
jgi:hypothetical protein